MKNNKGITLISLVVTIIVLLILAGVSIAMLSGDNSILSRAKETGYKTQLSNAQDVIGTAITEQVANFMNFKYVDSNATAAYGNVAYASGDDIDKAIEYGIKSACGSLAIEPVLNGTAADAKSETTVLTVHYLATTKKITVSYNGYKTVGSVSDSGILKWESITKN